MFFFAYFVTCLRHARHHQFEYLNQQKTQKEKKNGVVEVITHIFKIIKTHTFNTFAVTDQVKMLFALRTNILSNHVTFEALFYCINDGIMSALHSVDGKRHKIDKRESKAMTEANTKERCTLSQYHVL